MMGGDAVRDIAERVVINGIPYEHRSGNENQWTQELARILRIALGFWYVYTFIVFCVVIS